MTAIELDSQAEAEINHVRTQAIANADASLQALILITETHCETFSPNGRGGIVRHRNPRKILKTIKNFLEKRTSNASTGA